MREWPRYLLEEDVAGWRLFDLDDLALVSGLGWSASGGGYAKAKTGGKVVRMHQLIANCPEGMEIDHINGNGLDNRRSNLRVCEHKQNCFNQRAANKNHTGLKGVSWHKRDKVWQANIGVGGKTIYLGRFVNPADAALAYNIAAVRHFGEYARLNNV